MTGEQDQIHTVRELLEDFDDAMLVFHQQHEGKHRAVPMAIAKVEQDCGLWFFSGRDTHKTTDLSADDRVLVTCQDDHSRYVSLCGRAELVDDRAKASELWDDHYKTWFPKGVDDPNLMLIHVRPEEAEYWDNQGLKGMRYLFKAAKAYATGTKPEMKEGEQHGKVLLRTPAA